MERASQVHRAQSCKYCSSDLQRKSILKHTYYHSISPKFAVTEVAAQGWCF